MKTEKGGLIDSLQTARLARAAMEGKKASDIRLFDVRGVSGVTDFFLVATGNSPPHLKALAEETRRRLKEAGVHAYGAAGAPESGWMVLDFVDVIIHVFLPGPRAYYAIEDLWESVPQIG